MNKPDLLITWHESADYPIAREMLRRHRDFFGKIIIYWSQHFRYPIFSHFIQTQLHDLGNITFLDPVNYEFGIQDWRNVATNEMLRYSNSEWICSIEQDWFSTDWNRLLDMTKTAMEKSDMCGWMSETAAPYIHPAFFFAKREIIERAGYDFTPHPEINGSDHFAAITWRAKELGAVVTGLPVGEVTDQSLAFHLGGVNQNYLEGLKPGYAFHRPEIFYVYNYWSRRAKINKKFRDLCLDIDSILRPQFPSVYPHTSPWADFFR